MMADGAWIILNISPEEMASKGIPKVGDPVVLDHDERYPPHSGIAQAIGSATDTNKNSYRAREDGPDFMFSAKFGTSTLSGGASSPVKLQHPELKVSIPADTLAAKNNNPGNLRFAGQKGAVNGKGNSTGSFAQFTTPEAGFQALLNQIRLDSKRGKTIESFICGTIDPVTGKLNANGYAPSSDGNNTSIYVDFLVSFTGASSKNVKIADIDPVLLAKAISKHECGAKVL